MPAPLTRSGESFSEQFDPKLLASLGDLKFKARYLMEGFFHGQHASPFHGFSLEFSDYRRYQPGDELRHLDWKLYARSDRLCIKRFMQETNLDFYVLCDTSASMSYQGERSWGSKLDCAKVLAAGLSWFLLNQNDAAGMITLDGTRQMPELIRPSQKPSQLGLILKQLDRLSVAGGACLVNLLQNACRLVRRRSLILFISDLLEPAGDIAVRFNELRFSGHEVIVFQVLDPDEIEFPFTESAIMEDLESGERRIISPTGSAREQYLERFKVFMAEYESLFQRLEIPYCVVRTDQRPWNALSKFLAERQKLN